MKTIKSLSLFLCLFPFLVNAQLNEGYFQFHIDVTAVDTTMRAKQTAAMMRNSKMEIYFADGLSRIDFSMGEISYSSSRINRKTNKAISISEGPSGKMANQDTADKIGGKVGDVRKNPNIKVTAFNEYKTILGFKCRKYIMSDKGVYTTYWITDQINIKDLGHQVVNPNLPGFPLEFTSINEGVKMSFKASNFTESIVNKSDVFSTDPPSDYKKIDR
jgi:GLPGLI family protein